MENMENEKKTTSNGGKKFGFLLLFASIVLILLGGVLMFIEGDSSGGTSTTNTGGKDFTHNGITLKTVSGYQYERVADSISFYNSKNDFYISEIKNNVMSDDELNNVVESLSNGGLQVLDSGSKDLSNGKNLKYILVLSSGNKFMMFYYNAIDSYVVCGNVTASDYDAVKEEIAKVFNGIKIDSSAVSEDVENNDEVVDDGNTPSDGDLSGEMEIQDNTVVNSDSNSIKEDTTTDNNVENTTDIHTNENTDTTTNENQENLDGNTN